MMNPRRVATRARLLVMGACLVAVAAGACSYTADDGPTHRFAEFPDVNAAPGVERGEVLYKRDCAWCHADDGTGTERAPDILSDPQGGASTHFMLTTGRMPLDYPDEPVRRRDPVYATDEITDVVAYVESLGSSGPPVPVVDLDEGDLALGQQLYNQDCAACHSTTGIGGALPAIESDDLPSSRVPRPANVIPGLFDASPEEIVEALQTGPGPMPVFEYDEHESDSVARYVTYLQSPDNRGGASIGGIGPVAEGAVGWLVGLGVILLVCRWIGTTRKDEEGDA
jgi:ubiquinol-cytochrome c reductase cytochrome c subunit